MKKNKLIVLLMLFTIFMPFIAKAEEVSTTGVYKTPVNVYFFHGDGCPHCAEASEWFESIEEEYGSYFKVVPYEVWNDEDNKKLMDDVAKYLNETVTGVPFIIVGDRNFKGYNEEIGKDILEEIKRQYELDDLSRTDVIKQYEENKENDEKSNKELVTTIWALVILAIIVAFVVFARRGIDKTENKKVFLEKKEEKNTKEVEEKEIKEVKEEKTQPEKKEVKYNKKSKNNTRKPKNNSKR